MIWTTCRFEWEAADRHFATLGKPPADRSPVDTDGCFVFTCHPCGDHWHWCLPAVEAEGSEASSRECVWAAMDAVTRSGQAVVDYRVHGQTAS